ncbi:hypothetical protein [Psychrobium sp. 1_MG-2023]|uniref:hypothetical protein n=1 Tax=Psychrobium sp. 1_MG-2023 TaxID=3062624 RepID=UPI000C341DA8|nr:hypothetical protein [Psychrobium sp. 1_MG-2023]MDP2561919.1 hypothetical protein [Psychrobium sp. 1_MG-2023]PKF59668.1 hypothetical protein CW748_00240 [Alteromonadales bacterium alter-6D02]
MINKWWLAIVCLGLCLEVQATDGLRNDHGILKQKIEQAIVEFEKTPKQQWAFQVERYENEEGDITSSIEQFKPNTDVDKQWSLISLNGGVPSEKQQRAFFKSKQDSQKGNHYSLKLSDIINQESLTFNMDTGSHIKMNFDLHVSQFAKGAQGDLTGTLSYNKQLEFIEEIVVVNKEDFSPMFSATISELKLTFKFIKINDVILFKQQELQMKGLFAYFIEIDEISHDTYSNYEYVPMMN